MPRKPATDSPHPKCPHCGGNSSISRTLKSGSIQYRCNRRGDCGKEFTVKAKNPGRPKKKGGAMNSTERSRKRRERLRKEESAKRLGSNEDS